MDLILYSARGKKRKRGQIIVILALAMVFLLAAVGLATDVGMAFMQRAHLERATDAAALAGVVKLAESNSLTQANTRGMQLLAANDIVLSSPADCNVVDWTADDYCGDSGPGTIPGSISYRVETHWETNTFFMTIIGIDRIPLAADATAEYNPLVDIYASDSSEAGIVRSANQAVFGPHICSSYGDPVSPVSSVWYSDREGVYTYRVRIPFDYRTTYDSVRIELFDPDTSNKDNNGEGSNDEYRIFDLSGNNYIGDNNPSSEVNTRCSSNQKNPCLLDIPAAMAEVYQTSNTLSNDEEEQRLDTQEEFNPFWFIRIDENRGTGGGEGNDSCGQPYYYTPDYNTRTMFRLYYLQEQTDGRLIEVDLAYYIGKNDDNDQPILASSPYTQAQAQAEALATDMHWVSPGSPAGERAWAGRSDDDIFGTPITWPSELGSTEEPFTYVEDCNTYRTSNPLHSNASSCSGNGDFIVELTGANTEVPGIYVDPESRIVDVFMDVRTINGSSENGFEIWAGPTISSDPALQDVPSEINARQNYIVRARGNDIAMHSSEGVGVFAIGYRPMNMDVTSTVQIPLGFFSSAFADQDLTISLFDSDSGTNPPVSYYFDSIPNIDWTACFDDNTSGSNCDEAGGQGSHYVGPDQVPNNDGWSTYAFTIPGELDVGNPIPFYGGRLFVHYSGGAQDTFVWRIVIDSRPYLTQ